MKKRPFWCLGISMFLLAILVTALLVSPSRAYAVDWKLYGEGNADENVRTIQYLLKHHKQKPGPVDGIFGDDTRKAIENFQRVEGLHVDGIVGNETWTALIVFVSQGGSVNTKNAVKALQVQLKKHGLKPETNGTFGAKTRSALTAAQEFYGLTPNGVADTLIWQKLVNGDTIIVELRSDEPSSIDELPPYDGGSTEPPCLYYC